MATNSVILFPGSIFPSPYIASFGSSRVQQRSLIKRRCKGRKSHVFFPSLSDRGIRGREGEKKFPLFSRRSDIIERGWDAQIRRGHQRLNIFTCMRFLFPRCDWPSSFVSSFYLFFFSRDEARRGCTAPGWMLSSSRMGRTDYARELNLRRFTPRSSRLWGYFAFRCARVYVREYIFFSLFFPSFCLLLCTQGLHGNANRSR